MHWYLAPWRKFAVFSGRAGRMEYWMFILINFSIEHALLFVDTGSVGFMTRDHWGPLSLLFCLVVIIPFFAVAVRRLHDTNRSGWWVLIQFIPLIGVIVWLIFALQKSHPAENQYGPNPVDARTLSANDSAFVFGAIGIALFVILLNTGIMSSARQGKATNATDPTSKSITFNLRMRQAEVKTSLQGIYVAERAFYGEHKRYGTFEEMGMLMNYDRHYTYRIDSSERPGTVIPANKGQVTPDNSVVSAGYTATGFTATATANIDADPTIDQWHVNDAKQGLSKADVDDATD